MIPRLSVLVQQLIDDPILTVLGNSSLREEGLPVSQKCSIILSISKHDCVDQSDPAKCAPYHFFTTTTITTTTTTTTIIVVVVVVVVTVAVAVAVAVAIVIVVVVVVVVIVIVIVTFTVTVTV